MSEIIVRNTGIDDVPAIAEIYRGESAAAGTLQNPYISTDDMKKRFSSASESSYSLVGLIDNEVVGQLGLFPILLARRKQVGGIGMAVKDSHHGQGVGSALLNAAMELADNWLDLRRIELTVFTDNEAAVALYKKFGFVIEGEAKEFAFRKGQYVNAYYMARLINREPA